LDHGSARPKKPAAQTKVKKSAFCRKCQVMHPPPVGRNCTIPEQMADQSDSESLPDTMPTISVPVMVPPGGTEGVLVGEFRQMATVMASIVMCLYVQQTQLNAIQDRVLYADLTRGNGNKNTAGADAIAQPLGQLPMVQPGMQ
jgi:hypothetical protein